MPPLGQNLLQAFRHRFKGYYAGGGEIRAQHTHIGDSIRPKFPGHFHGRDGYDADIRSPGLPIERMSTS